MDEEDRNIKTEPSLSNTDLAFERTIMGHERTLMAWIRTTMSLISFGFTIYKFLQQTSTNQAGQQRLLTPRLVGMIMILFGLVGLFFALLDHKGFIKKIRKAYPATQSSRSFLLGVLVFIFGLLLFLGVLFRQ
ncbi:MULTISPECIES: YidH family protein [Niastella]|uniref:DUF202 domain-containing protein n=1 Tax=Niastella soli TaxID=2821487 RepID=A0ABS3YXZ3_9BACT|nr:DUF202 domain-containing protein [Niastella soli]MBO9202802.1 DUF202 domain-containing protein [Niastella soli]